MGPEILVTVPWVRLVQGDPTWKGVPAQSQQFRDPIVGECCFLLR